MMARVLLTIAVVVWGWTFVATKIVLPYVTPAELLGLRMIIALPILLGICLAKRLSFNFSGRDYFMVLVGSAVITTHFLIQITGLQWTSATNTGWIISVTPLALAVMAPVFLKEHVSRNAKIGICVATVGIFLLISRGDFSTIGWLKSVGDWLVLVSAFTWAIYTMVTRDIVRRLNPFAVTFAILLPTGIITISYMLVTSIWTRFLAMPLEAVLALLFLGVLGSALAHLFWQIGVARLGAARAGIFLYLEPVATTLLAVPYLDEPFGVVAAIGGLLVLLGVWWAQRRSSPKAAGEVVLSPDIDG